MKNFTTIFIFISFLSPLVLLSHVQAQETAAGVNNSIRKDHFRKGHKKPPKRKPPIEAFYACENKAVGEFCTVNAPHGLMEGQCDVPHHFATEDIYCIPDRLPPPPPHLSNDGYGQALERYDLNDGYGEKRNDGY